MKENQNVPNRPSYRVEVKQGDATIVYATDISQMEIAVKLSLSLHEASNTKHIIHVIHDDIIDVTFIRYA